MWKFTQCMSRVVAWGVRTSCVQFSQWLSCFLDDFRGHIRHPRWKLVERLRTLSAAAPFIHHRTRMSRGILSTRGWMSTSIRWTTHRDKPTFLEFICKDNFGEWLIRTYPSPSAAKWKLFSFSIRHDCRPLRASLRIGLQAKWRPARCNWEYFLPTRFSFSWAFFLPKISRKIHSEITNEVNMKVQQWVNYGFFGLCLFLLSV